ncbi:hypothetical protein Nepgr_016964 [Nepenthes gracilis]|uniref:REF/SRPP-like protein n=1 Tax=Nepenthes gracilis TaxID=150966 RepID=A0AAD3SNJ8_NEPGR|nr:hypothetical protein Nepgr_016964 [Nepenthes gracilis]
MECAAEKKDQELKHLGFVRVGAIMTIICLTNLYEDAKRKSGPLKSTVAKVEAAVTTVVAPVYDKFKGVPDDLLVFLDKKVDTAAEQFDKHAPPLAKQVASHSLCMIKKASAVAQDLVHRAHNDGPRAAANYAATESKELVLNQTVKVWTKLDQLPAFHMAAEVAVPKAAMWLEKYNRAISDMSGKGYPLFSYVPSIPVDDIAKAFKQNEAMKQGNGSAHPPYEVKND